MKYCNRLYFQGRMHVPLMTPTCKHSCNGTYLLQSWSGKILSRSSSTIDTSKLLQKFPLQYLREMDRINFDPHTFQRTGVRFDIGNGKPLNVTTKQASVMYTMNQCVSDGSFYHITWGDGHVSTYSTDWLDEMLHNWDNTSAVTSYEKGRVLWKDLNEDTVRTSNLLCLSFQEAITDDGMKGSLKALYEYGFVLVTDTPIEDGGSGVAALASALGGGSNKDEPGNLLMHYRAGHFNEIMLPRGTDGPLRTLYGTVWSTASVGQAIGTSTADSSYGTEGLPLHTDMTYKYDPPGLQIFTMIQPAAHGGESVICDGFAVAAKLRDTHPDAFRLLCETTRRYHCIDQATGWHMEASGPIIGEDNNKQIIMIRHNDLDRLPDLPSPTVTDFHSFYAQLQSAHSVWDELLSDDAYRLVLQLRPGDTIVVANQRCLHGRYKFETSAERPRIIMGCYVGQDELSSRFRRMGFNLW